MAKHGLQTVGEEFGLGGSVLEAEVALNTATRTFEARRDRKFSVMAVWLRPLYPEGWVALVTGDVPNSETTSEPTNDGTTGGTGKSTSMANTFVDII